jgi:RNA polymerase sigma factor (sigma-70 family)
MSSAADLTSVIRHLRPPAGEAADDPELLARYAAGRDEAAFVALVRRYGGLVLGVARRQLGDRHRAEDVFQATFLALARSAGRLGGRPVLANWLYTVALRQSRKLRARAARGAALERAAPPPPTGGYDPLAEITGRELLRAIDDELARLPDRLRLPVLLCYIQGLSREDAARRLGCSDGVVKGRLERGRRRLAARLAARGLAPSALLLAPLAAVSVPAALIARAADHAAAPWSKAVPAAVADLAATAATRTLLPVAVAAVCALAVGLGVWASTPAGPNPRPPEPTRVAAAAPAPVPKPEPGDPLPDGATLRFGSPRYRHPATIQGLSVSADGTLALAHSGTRANGAARLYDLATGRGRITLDLKTDILEAVALAPDGKTLATKRDFSVCLHDAATGDQTARIEYPRANPYSGADLLGYSPDGKRIVAAAAEAKALHLIDVAKGELTHTLQHTDVVFAAAWAPDGKRLVAGGYDRDQDGYFARVWDAGTGKEVLRLPFGNGGIRCVAFAPDGATVAVGGDGGKPLAVKLFDAATGKVRLTVPFPDASSVRSVAFSPVGKTLAASGGSVTRLFDAATGKELLKIDRKAIGLRFSPDGKVLVGAVAGTIFRWDAATGKALIPEGGESPIDQVEATADGKRIISRGQDGDAQVWDARTGKRLHQVNVSWQRGCAVSPDGRFLAWPAADETVQFKDPDRPNMTYTGSRLRLFDVTTGKPVERFDAFAGDANDLFFTADGKTLAAVDHDGTARFWNPATGKLERSVWVAAKGARNSVWRSQLSPDGKVLAVAHQPEGRGLFPPFRVNLCDAATGKERHDLPGHYSYVDAMAFSPDGKYLVTCGAPLSAFVQQRLKRPGDQAFVWDVATGQTVARLPGGGTAAAFAPDGKTLAIAEPDGTIVLRETTKWAAAGEFPGPRERVLALTFGPDGRLFSGSTDATVLAWDPKAAKPPAERK